MGRKNWIAVASAEHARRGRAAPADGGFPPGRPKENTAPEGLEPATPKPPAQFWTGGRGEASREPRPAGPRVLHEVKSVGVGYMQVCHGKCAPLKRMSAGDRVAYYAPALTIGGKDKLQRFVSIGLVCSGEPYAFDMGSGFVPFRRDVAYVAAREASILPLLDDFEFVQDRQRWGYKFRFGLFEVSEHDMRLIARAMGADESALAFGAAGIPAIGQSRELFAAA